MYLVKIGGSIITDKSQQDTLRPAELQSLVSQIARAWESWRSQSAAKQTGKQKFVQLPNQQLILSHGQGSFAHFPAKQYEITRGLFRPDSVYGMAVTLDAVYAINRLVVRECIRQQLPAVPWFSSQSLVTKSKKCSQEWLKVLFAQLERGLIPVTTGDVVMDEDQGCAVWSGETILNYLATLLHDQAVPITAIIQVGEVPGVLDKHGQIVPLINQSVWHDIQEVVTAETKGVDVTGGMLQKVVESLQLAAETGIETWIIDGRKPDNLYQALTDGEWTGTRITAA